MTVERLARTPKAGARCPLGHPTGVGQSFCPLRGTLLAAALTSDPVRRVEQVASPVKGIGRAGTSARRQYKAMRRVWLRRIRLRFWMFAAALGVLLVLPMAVMASANQHWIWGFGFVSGASLAIMVGVREFPPGYITNWQDGAQGEEWTAKELRPLAKQGWTVMHDLRDRRGDGKGNFDHVLVGRQGCSCSTARRGPASPRSTRACQPFVGTRTRTYQRTSTRRSQAVRRQRRPV